MRSSCLFLMFVYASSFICKGGNHLSVPVHTQGQIVPFDKKGAYNYLDYLITTENYNQLTVDLATPLMLAARFGLIDQARILFEKNSAVDAVHPEYNVTALTIAATKGYVDMVSLLVCDANDRISAVVRAAKHGHISILKLFFPHVLVSSFSEQVNINSANEGDTALTAAIRAGQGRAIDFLLEHGADVNCIAPGNITPLGCALLGEHHSIAQLLIDKGGCLPDISWSLSENPEFEVQIQEQGRPVEYLLKKSSIVKNLIHRYREKHYKIQPPLRLKKDDWLFYQQGGILVGETGDFVVVAYR